MYEWEERKLVQEALEKEREMRKREKERLEKMTKKERSYNTFKEWLKVSLMKQREELITKRMVEQEKQMED
jgi:hypothetical protein